MSKWIEQIIIAGLAVMLVFTALAHGAVEPWSVAIYSLLVTLLLELWIIRMVVERRATIKIPVTALPLLCLILLGLAQLIPFRGRRLTFDAEATVSTLITLGLLLGAMLLFANFLMTRPRLKRAALLLTGFGFALAIFALIQHYSWNGKFFWLRPMGSPPSPFGPFLNHSNFAGYMELLVPIPIGLVVAGALRGPVRLFAIFAAALMSLSVILSLSRGGMIGLIAGLVFLAVTSIWWARSRNRSIETEPSAIVSWFRHIAVVLLVLGAAFLGMLWLGPDAVMDSVAPIAASEADLEKQTFFYNRGWIWKDTLAMIRANPLSGVGLGAFGAAYPVYTSSDGSLRVEAAHNDYLQALSDAGLIGAALGIWFLVLLFRSIFRALASRDRLLAGLALGSGAGLFAVLIHSAFDFNLHLPSNSLLFLLLVTIAEGVTPRRQGSQA
ncbi:MAG: O-antigen ligase family protein [Acidobacteriota bacterium]|nr:MAG: O-antigen ligase family protein [Acidobacteriota bacterium]